MVEKNEQLDEQRKPRKLDDQAMEQVCGGLITTIMMLAEAPRLKWEDIYPPRWR